MPATTVSPITLDDKYLDESGEVYLTGVQALVRVVLDQLRRDALRGLNSGAFASGYQGSPLGTFDKELQRVRALAGELGLVHQPGVNEELAATSVWGTQLAHTLPGARRDGIVGFWYGKSPGLERAADAIRHGNYVGTTPTGGVLALVGDDPSCKSSSLPSASEGTLSSLNVPVLYPGNLEEVLDYGLHGIACSRAAGTWVALKVVTNVADGAGTVLLDPTRVDPVMPELQIAGQSYRHSPSGHLLAPVSLEMERSLFTIRLPLAKLYARKNGLNRITVNPRSAHRGIIAAGRPYYELLTALHDSGLDLDDLERAGIRLLKVGMLFPLDEEIVRDFASGLSDVLVIEEKRPFLEDAVRSVLYGTSSTPTVSGKWDIEGGALVSSTGELGADDIAAALTRWVPDGALRAALVSRREALGERAQPQPLPIARSAFFCSGCPHNRSTDAPAGSPVGVGIGCHTMVILSREDKGDLVGMTQMGAEGAQWIGISPFTDTAHFTQNLGDGTFHHSGSLAIRAAVAANVNITYKILYNGFVSMTGGQAVEGRLTVPALAQELQLEGVKRVVITTDAPNDYRGVELPSGCTVHDRRDLDDLQRELATTSGVTVIIHDQACAAELRRMRKRGIVPDRAERMFINQRVCEGCGDCGRASDCLSVVPADTEFGRKTTIDQATCNKDYSCLEGDCPSFLTVIPAGKARTKVGLPPVELTTPVIQKTADYMIRMPGIGGTGVVTISQLVGMAARLDGLHVWGLDQTGLSQKGGPVVSDVRISRSPITGANRASDGTVDLLLGLDVLGAAGPVHLRACDPTRTVAVVSTSEVATGHMVMNPEIPFPQSSQMRQAIDAATRSERNVYLDAKRLSDILFHDNMPANTIVLGAAFQAGALPISLDSIEQAIRLNGAAVDENLAAFAWGRAAVSHPAVVAEVLNPKLLTRTVDSRATGMTAGLEPQLRELVSSLASDLIGYQNVRLARRYVDAVGQVSATEGRRLPGSVEIAESFARGLHKLMAYKDEYEVARLHLDPIERARVEAEFGPGARIAYNLHPPLLRAMGMKSKLKLGPWFDPAFATLRSMRVLRGTKLDVFGYAEVRRTERELIDDYQAEVSSALAHLSEANKTQVLNVCKLPDLVRGYEHIKLANVERYRAEQLRLRQALTTPAGVTLDVQQVASASR